MSADKLKAFYKKMKTDRKWYLEKFLRIRNKKSQLVPLRLNDAQVIVDDIITKCDKEGRLKRFIILKARQMGLSTYFNAIMYHDTSTNEFKNSMIIAHEDKATQNLFNMSKLFYEELPDVIRPMKKYSNEQALSFENPTNDEVEKKKNPGLRSKITVATAKTVDTGRSATFHNIHASEVAFWADAKTLMLGLLQCVPDELNTMVVLESTANGVGDYFHEMWTKAVKGENEFIPIFLGWYTDRSYTRPFQTEEQRNQFIEEVNAISLDEQGREVFTYERELMDKFSLTYEQLNWRKWCIANKCGGDEEKFQQEYPATPEEAFIASGRPRFNVKSLKKYRTLTKEPIRGYIVERGNSVEFIQDKKGYVAIWKMPEKDKYYCIGSDVAEGLEHGDYSTALVGSEDFEVVASWYGHIDPDLYGEELVKLARFYNEAYLGVESNNHGLTTLKAILRKEYWNVYYQKNYDRLTNQLTKKLGWNTNLRTKPMMIDKLAEFLRESYLAVFWDTFITECFTYVIDEKGGTNAQLGANDDTVMACAIMLQLLLEGKGENYTPEIPFDETKTFQQKLKANNGIVDKLFEGDTSQEVAE